MVQSAVQLIVHHCVKCQPSFEWGWWWWWWPDLAQQAFLNPGFCQFGLNEDLGKNNNPLLLKRKAASLFTPYCEDYRRISTAKQEGGRGAMKLRMASAIVF